jgi:hypothetical protein
MQQAGGAVQGAGAIHPRRRLNALVAIAAIVVIAAVVALVVWVMPLETSGVGAEDAAPKAAGAGSAVIPNEGLYYPLPQGKVAPAVIDADGLYYPLPHEKVAPDA